MVKRRTLLAWESGAGRGHIVTLKTVAEALGPGFVHDAALCRMDHAAELAPLCDLVFRGARLRYDRTRREGPDRIHTATWGEFLGDSGFRDGALLARQVGWWRETLIARCTDLVIADYAPCALMAALSLGIPAVAVGTGYSVPPEGMDTFPVYLPDYAQQLYDEAAMVATINAALAPLGVPELARLPDVYRRSGELVRTLDMLDPYCGQRTAALLPPVADVAATGDGGGGGEEIFCYFSTTELADPGVIAALATLKMPVRAYCPGLDDGTARALAATGVMLETMPVPVDLIARRSRLIVHAGQHGMLCLGLAAGLPQVAMPQHLEHLYHARRCEAQRCCRIAGMDARSADALGAIIESSYKDETMREAAIATARALHPQFTIDAPAMIRERLLPLLD